MPAFPGFPDGRAHLTRIPEPFFTQLLPQIDHAGELKITLFALWLLDRQEGKVRYFTLGDCLEDSRILSSFGEDESQARASIEEALARAVERGSLLRVSVEKPLREDTVYFLNSARGRAAVQAMQAGQWSPFAEGHASLPVANDRPNIYQLYEENIGPLTPLMVDALRDAEGEYSQEMIEAAIRAAVENNVRRWRYVEAILRAWKEKGRHEQDRRNPEENRRRYVEGQFADFIEH